jgi:hypothetical protein
LYKKHASLQSAVSGISYEVSLRQKLSDFSHGWDISAKGQGNRAETNFEFLSWNDIVRQQWHAGVPNLVKDLAEFFRHYTLSGLFFFFGKRAPQQLIAGFYPSVFMTLSAVICLFLAYALSKPFDGIAALLFASAVFLVGMKIFMLVAEKYAVFWVLRILVFSSRWSRGEVAGIKERTGFFARRIAAALEEGYDEVMLVSHSVGCMLAIPVMDEVLRITAGSDQKIVMLTLGSAFP